MPQTYLRACAAVAAVIFLAALALAPDGAFAQAREAQTWVTYKNARFGSTLRYPADWFTPERAPANGAGRSFRDNRTGASFVIFGGFNIDELSARQLEAETRGDYKDARITYARKKGNWFVLSGIRGGTIFYHKGLISSGGRLVHHFIATYPVAVKADFNPVVAEMALSMSVSKAVETE